MGGREVTHANRWDRCVTHRGADTKRFCMDYFGDKTRTVSLIAGAGFDPRSTVASELLSEAARDRVEAVFLREERPEPKGDLLDRAHQNLERMTELIPNNTVHQFEVFDFDAVVGGRRAVGCINSLPFNGVTDIVVDLSALSIGVAFPTVRHLLHKARSGALSTNIHLLVTDEPTTDAGIRRIAHDRADFILGFKGGFGLDANSRAAKLWLPQLSLGRRASLGRIHQRLSPHAVCPILPFPASNPRLPDELIEHYGSEFGDAWQVDARDVIYAHERSPLDLYRAVLRIDDARKRVFADVGGSLVILSPLGNKALAVGALMAAYERDFCVAYVEAAGYDVDFGQLDRARQLTEGEVIHVWLHGNAAPAPAVLETDD